MVGVQSDALKVFCTLWWATQRRFARCTALRLLGCCFPNYHGWLHAVKLWYAAFCGGVRQSSKFIGVLTVSLYFIGFLRDADMLGMAVHLVQAIRIFICGVLCFLSGRRANGKEGSSSYGAVWARGNGMQGGRYQMVLDACAIVIQRDNLLCTCNP